MKMTYHFKNKREVSLEVTKMMWKPNLEHKASLKMIINFYKLLLSDGTVKVGGSAYQRFNQLKNRLND